MRVPYKKSIFRKDAVLDFSKAEEAPEKEWLDTGRLGSMLLDIFPYDVKKLIMGKDY